MGRRRAIDYARKQAERALAADRLDPGPALQEDSFPGYSLVEEIHRGGQGVVYRATQASTNRTVAIKVLRRGTGPADRSRFEREVEILSELHHPNIVHLSDGGTRDGFHFLVMDYIDGQALDAYLREARPSLEKTLRLFARICRAVGAAHLRGVIHRDLKPSNILIDEHGQPHVVDFGLAKLAPERLGPGGVQREVTIAGQFLGSIPWASPEQARGATDDIDVRTDVYALGLILFHMITGGFPYETSGSMHTILSGIIDAEPARPSEISHGIDDELDTIALKCLAKTPDRRYQTANDLARDVERHLAGEPIEAKRDSTLYLLSKTMRRHRTITAVAVVLLVAVVGYALTITALLQRAQSAERNAERMAEQAREKFRQAHNTAQVLVGEVSDRLANVSGASEARRLILETAYEQLEQLATQEYDDRELLADLAKTHHGLGDISMDLGRLDESESHLKEALTLRQELADADPGDVSRQADLSIAIVRVGDVAKQRGLLRQAEEFYTRALGIDERLAGTDSENLRYLDNLLWSYDRMGDMAERRFALNTASAFYAKQQALAIQLAAMEPDNPERLNGLRTVAAHRSQLAAARESWEEAVDLRRETIELTERLVAAQPDHRNHLQKLGSDYLGIISALLRANRPAEARELLDKAETTVFRLVDGDPADTTNVRLLAMYHAKRAAIAADSGDTDAHRASLREQIGLLDGLVELEPDNPRRRADLLFALRTCSIECHGADCAEEARACAQRGLRIAEEVIDTPLVSAAFLWSYASLLRHANPESLRRPDQAIAICRRAVEMTGQQDPVAIRRLGALLAKTGHLDEAIETFESALDLPDLGESPLRDSIQQALDRCRAAACETGDH